VRIHRKTAAALTATALVATLGVTVIDSAAAAAASVGCNEEFSRGPNWYAGVDASSRAGRRMVADIAGPSTASGAQAHMWHWYEGASQHWCLDPTANGSSGGTFYRVRNYFSGKCLDAGSATNRTLVKQRDCATVYNQQWWITKKGTYNGWDTYQFRSLANGQVSCLDVTDFGYTDGTVLQMYGCSAGKNQLFY